MFHVVDHACVVYTGELSQSTQFIIDRYGKNLDEAIRSGIRILDTHSLVRLNDWTTCPESAD